MSHPTTCSGLRIWPLNSRNLRKPIQPGVGGWELGGSGHTWCAKCPPGDRLRICPAGSRDPGSSHVGGGPRCSQRMAFSGRPIPHLSFRQIGTEGPSTAHPSCPALSPGFLAPAEGPTASTPTPHLCTGRVYDQECLRLPSIHSHPSCSTEERGCAGRRPHTPF